MSSEERFSKSLKIARLAREVFAWHERPGALERLTPPWEKIELLEQGGIHDGARVKLRSKLGPCWLNWSVEHRDYVQDRQFCDVLQSGPFPAWEHRHRFTSAGTWASVLTDEVSYRLPGGVIGKLIGGRWVKARLQRAFAYRHAITQGDLEWVANYGAVRRMKILVTGSSGLVGSALIPFLKSQGHDIVRLVRGKPRPRAGEVFWDPAKGELDYHSLRGVDVVIHLAGENLAAGRWTAERREAIKSSRVQGTRTLVDALDKMKHRPFAMVSASAVGFYGSFGDEWLDEDSGAGRGFLAEVCDEWEHEAERANELGIRTTLLRTGMVLTPAGGALARMAPVFRCGLGGRLGGGRQWLSWISIDDLLGVIYHAILDQRCVGPMNAVSPEPVSNADFSRVLARVLARPAMLPVPAWALRTAFGAMADEALLASARVRPQRLLASGFVFRHPRLEPALRHLLGRQST